MYLGNILTDAKQIKNAEFLNVVKEKDNCIENIPTLIVGYEKVKSLYSDNEFSMLNWKIDDTIYWTFGRRERGERFEKDFNEFKKLVFNTVLKEIKYNYINLLISNREEKNKLFNIIKNNTKKTVYLDKDIVFVCENNNKTVYGFSLLDIDYEEHSRNNILKLIYNNSNIDIVKLDNSLPFEMWLKLMQVPYIIPYVLQI